MVYFVRKPWPTVIAANHLTDISDEGRPGLTYSVELCCGAVAVLVRHCGRG